jgi:hypothetical protein
MVAVPPDKSRIGVIAKLPAEAVGRQCLSIDSIPLNPAKTLIKPAQTMHASHLLSSYSVDVTPGIVFASGKEIEGKHRNAVASIVRRTYDYRMAVPKVRHMLVTQT